MIDTNYSANGSNTIQHHYSISSFPKKYKKIGNVCYCLNYLEKSGSIHVIHNSDSPNVYLSKLTLVCFDDNFENLLEKGQLKSKDKIKDENYQSIPDTTFYEQRYYYYSKYDEGIKMDNESKFF